VRSWPAESRGLGRATALELAREGCEVVLAARSEQPLTEAARADSAETSTRVEAIPFDVTDTASINDLVKPICRSVGGRGLPSTRRPRTGGHSEEADVYASASEQE